MALNREFLGRLDREIASLKERIATNKEEQAASDPASEELLREIEARLKHLEEIRTKIIQQSHGG